MIDRPKRTVLVLAALTACVLALASTATASPTALSFGFIEAQCEIDQPANTLRDQALAVPGVANVTLINNGTSGGGPGTIPTAADLATYDAVVVMADCSLNDPEAIGNALADFQDAGGIVIAAAPWTLDDGNTSQILGRWLSGGYNPALGVNHSFGTVPVAFNDPAHPIFAGVGDLTAYYFLTLTATPGATTLATVDGTPFVAIKGRAATINELLGDYNMQRTGNYGQLLVNITKFLGKQPVAVTKAGNGSGTVISSLAGIDCGVACTSYYSIGVDVTLTAKAAKNSTFTGWGASCAGRGTCTKSIAYPGVNVTATFASTKLKIGKPKKGVITVTVPGAGKLVVSGKGVKKLTKKSKKRGKLKLKLKTTGKLKKSLAAGKSGKAKLKFAFTPTGGGTGTTKKTVTFK